MIQHLHQVGVNVRSCSVNETLNWCSHSCKNLHFFSVILTPSIFMCMIVFSVSYSTAQKYAHVQINVTYAHMRIKSRIYTYMHLFISMYELAYCLCIADG